MECPVLPAGWQRTPSSCCHGCVELSIISVAHMEGRGDVKVKNRQHSPLKKIDEESERLNMMKNLHLY